MLKCNYCGHTFEVEDLHMVQECVGEFWGSPAWETWYYCPYCDSDDYEECDEEDEEHKRMLKKALYMVQEMDKK